MSHGPAIQSGTLAYYGDWNNNRVYSFNPVTGARGTLSFQGDNQTTSTPAIGNGRVFVNLTFEQGFDPAGRVVAINPATMTQSWSFTTFSIKQSNFESPSPTVGPDGDVVIPSSTATVWRLDDATGTPLWTQSNLFPAYRTLVFSRDDSKVFVANGNYMTALNYSNGAVAWQVNTFGAVGAPAVAPNGTLIFGNGGSKLFALNSASGAQVWSKDLPGEVVGAPAFSPDGTAAYIPSQDFRVYARRVSDGQPLWSYTLTGPVDQAPVVDKAGRIYVADRSGRVVCLSPAGALVWRVDLPGDVRGSMSIGPDNTLFVGFSGSLDRGLAAIRMQPILYLVQSMSQDQGATSSGAIPDVLSSNNQHLFGYPLSGTYPRVRYVFEGTVEKPDNGLAQTWTWLEASTSVAGIEQRVEMYNWVKGSWSLVSSRLATVGKDSYAYGRRLSDAAQYINTSGRVRARVTFKAPNLSGTGWTARIDRVAFGVVPTFQVP